MASRFLVSRLSALGDVACTLPVAAGLKSLDPEARVVWAVDPRFAGVVECCDAVDEVACLRPGANPKSWKVSNEPFDAAFDMQGLLKSALVVCASRAPVKFGYHWQREGAGLFSQAVRPDPTSHHVVDQYVDVVRAFGASVDRADFRLRPKPDDAERMRLLLAERGVTGRFALMNAGAGWESKRWPLSRFVELVRRLEAEGVQVAFLGGPSPGERAAMDALRAEVGDAAADLVGKTNVRELVALVARAAVHVGGDTGSTHIAAALGVPAVGLYAHTRPERVCPYGQRDRCVVARGGMAEIDVEPVFEQILRAWRGG